MANKARSVELAIIISYPTSASGILLKTPPKYRKLDLTNNQNIPKKLCIQPSKLTFFLSGHLATDCSGLVASEKF